MQLPCRVLLPVKVVGIEGQVSFINPKDKTNQTFDAQNGTVIIIPVTHKAEGVELAATLSPLLGQQDVTGYYTITADTLKMITANQPDIYNSSKAGFIASHQAQAESLVYLKKSSVKYLLVNVPDGEEICFEGDVKEVPEGKQYGQGSFFVVWDAWNGYRMNELSYGLNTLLFHGDPVHLETLRASGHSVDASEIAPKLRPTNNN